MKRGPVSRGTIILLNGTTSAGKTTIGRALQEVMDDPWLLSGFDHFQAALPPGFVTIAEALDETSEGLLAIDGDGSLREIRSGPFATITENPNETFPGVLAVYDDGGLQEVRHGAFAREVFAGVHRAMAALSDAGLNVIVENALTDEEALKTLASIFHDYPAYFVCIDVSFAAAEERERARGDRGPGNVRYFYDKVYALNDIYDLRVDAEANDPETCAVLIRAAVKATEPLAMAQLNRQLHW